MANEVIGPRRTVILAGISPGGEPVTVNETVLAAGLDADGVARYLSVDAEGNLASSGGDGVAASAVNLAGTIAARPAAGTDGRTYYATDTGRLYRDNGSSWVHVSINPSVLLPVIATLSGDVSISQANVFFDGPSLVSLPVGTYKFSYAATMLSAGGGETTCFACLYDGTTRYASSEQTMGAGACTLTGEWTLVLSVATTVKVQVEADGGAGWTLKRFNTGTGLTAVAASYLVAIPLV